MNRRSRSTLIGVASFVSLMVAGCQTCDQRVVDSGHAFVDTVGVRYLKYVNNDPELSPEQRQLEADLVGSFELILEAANESAD
jgi:hypothetical protein